MPPEKASPLVTVYMPSHNRGDRAVSAAESVIAQTHRNIELIIVDDASDPASADALKRFAETNPDTVRLLRNETNLGAQGSRNRALEAARGEFITGIDDDDEFLPFRLAAFVRAWQEDAAFLYADDLFDHGGGRLTRWRKQPASLDRLLSSNTVGNQVFTRTERIRTLGGFDTELTSAQDYDLWLRLCLTHGAGTRIPVASQIVCKENSLNRISNTSRTWRGYWAVYRKHGEHLSRRHRKSRVATILWAKGAPLTWRRLVTLFSWDKRSLFVRWAHWTWSRRITQAIQMLSTSLRPSPGDAASSLAKNGGGA